MRAKFLLYILLLCFVLGLYLYTSPSYQKSLEAKVYYALGDYYEANILAQEAYDIDKYNKMAFTLLSQSNIALKYDKYIQEARKYLSEISIISNKEKFETKDKVKVKMMCEIMIEDYNNLNPSKLTKESLKIEAKKLFLKFNEIYEQLF